MELRKGRLRRNGINNLTDAIHEKHGLSWTDGRGVFLAPVNVIDGDLVHNKSTKLGEFEYVRGVNWSCDLGANMCYMCLIHGQTVSIWKVEGQAPNLNIRQCRKINADPIMQGCLWNPCRDILCILNTSQCSFYFRHVDNKGSFALPTLDRGTITSGTWTGDGKKLIVSIGPAIAVYTWADIDKSMCEYNMLSWKVPGLDGKICSMVGITYDQIACTMELPLEKLCHNTSAMFKMPDITQCNGTADHWEDDSNGYVTPRQINQSLTVTDQLLHLQQDSNTITDSSQLLLISTNGKRDPIKLCSEDLPNLLAPDLLHYEAQLQLIVVGSNSQNILRVFSLQNSSLQLVHTITLNGGERPKGLCSVPVNQPTHGGILVMVGKLQDTSSLFLPSSPDNTYDLYLKCLPILPSHHSKQENLVLKEFCIPKENGDVHLVKVNPLCEELCNREPAASKQLHQSNSSSSNSIPQEPRPKVPPRRNSKKSKMASNYGKNVKDSSPGGDKKWKRSESFQYVGERGGDRPRLHQRSMSAHDETRSLSNSTPDVTLAIGLEANNGCVDTVMDHVMNVSRQGHSTDNQIDDIDMQKQLIALEEDLKSQGGHISKLHSRLENVMKQLDTMPCVSASKYQTLEAPELISVTCRYGNGDEAMKTFLLDNGRIQLERVQDAFDLKTVEIILEAGVTCIVGSNIDGYIPMKFKSSSTLAITGRRCALPMTPTSSTVSGLSVPDSAISACDHSAESFESDS